MEQISWFVLSHTCIASSSLSLFLPPSSPSPPTASRIRCPTLVPPAFGSVQILGDGLLGSIAMYMCDLGYEVVGQSKRVCELVGLVGEWSGEPPTCRGKETTRYLLMYTSDST